MREIIGDLFTYKPKNVNGTDHILRCVTTNGILTKDGCLVMGAGIAKQAKMKHPDLPYILGQKVSERGNHVYIIDQYDIASFPTKHHWKDKSDINLIIQSCRELVCFAKTWDYVLLTRPGCGLGGLVWEEVKSIIEPILNDDKFIVVHA